MMNRAKLMTNQHLTDQEIAQLLKEKAAGFKLSAGEKQAMKYNLMERVAISDVTKSTEQGYRWWKYQLNFKGAAMPFLPILIALLLAGSAGTATLANTAKPGDPLYLVDQWMEQLQQRFTNRAEVKAKLYARFADERLKELEELRNTDPSELTDRAKALWEEHQQEAIERLTRSIEQVTTVQDKFKEKLAATTDLEQKAVFQKVIDHLSDVQQKREDKLTQVENRTFPGLPNLELRQKIQEVRKEHQQEMQELRNQVKEEFKELKLESDADQPEDNSSDTSDNDSDKEDNADDDSDKSTPATGVTAQALEFRIPYDEHGNIDWDLYDTDHDGIPDQYDPLPNWPPHTM